MHHPAGHNTVLGSHRCHHPHCKYHFFKAVEFLQIIPEQFGNLLRVIAKCAAAPGSETDSRTTAAAYDGTTAATAFDVATATTAAKTASATAAICRTTAYGSAASIRGTV